MVWSIRLVPDAEADFDRLSAFLAGRSPAAASPAGEAIVAGIRSLSEYPYLGRRVGDGGRRELIIPFARSASIVRYLVEGDEVIVVRVFHGLEERPA